QRSAVLTIENRNSGRTNRGSQFAWKNFLRHQRELGSSLTNLPPFFFEPCRVSKGFASLSRQFSIARKPLQHFGWDNEARAHAVMEMARQLVCEVIQVQVSFCFHHSSFWFVIVILMECLRKSPSEMWARIFL